MKDVAQNAVVAVSDPDIAWAVARRFHECEGRVAVLGDASALSMKREAQRYSLFECDIGDEASIAGALEGVIADYGHIDALAAGWFSDSSADYLGVSNAIWDGDVARGVRSVWLCTKHALPGLRRAGSAAVVLLAPLDGIVTTKHRFLPAVASGALVGLTRTLALDLASQGIRVNAVICSVTPKAINSVRGNEQEPDPWGSDVSTVPLHRFGEPDDFAPVVHFLASEGAGYMTGSVITVDGGVSARITT